MISNNKQKICIVGLGYVGLPLAIAFAKKFRVVGFDIDKSRIQDLKNANDKTFEVEEKLLKSLKLNIKYTSNIQDTSQCNIYIITVPTPIDKANLPDLKPLQKSSLAVGSVLKKNDIVIYESTVFPGATEEICAPILESHSDLQLNRDFYLGYSPERINPGDKEHRLAKVKKLISGSTPEITNVINNLYKQIILAGTYKVSKIKIAEAAKVIENIQRDVNIALINEFSIIFNKLNIDTESVLEAAETKWNFIPFRPGLVGGHCIGVDPYYLTYKALELGYDPKMIVAGRKLNDSMGTYVVNQVIKLMNKKKINVNNSNVLIMGLTFKENCPDLRNTKVINIIDSFKKHNCNLDIYDPWVNPSEAMNKYKIKIIDRPEEKKYDVILLTVAHDKFKKLSLEQLKNFAKDNHVIYDIKYILKAKEVDGRL